MSRRRRLIIVILCLIILTLITYTVTIRRPLTHRQKMLVAYGEVFFRPCTLIWQPPESEKPPFGSVQAYIIYIDGIQRDRVDKSVFKWVVTHEGSIASIRSANSKANSEEISIKIPDYCLPLPKLP